MENVVKRMSIQNPKKRRKRRRDQEGKDEGK